MTTTLYSEDDCAKCEKHEVHFKPQYPIITLGKCVKWDTKREESGLYTIPAGSNVATLKSFIEEEGKILWASKCHGNTIVCMKSICQLQDAIQNLKTVLQGGTATDEEGEGEGTSFDY
ncbi:MAG: hypothetical protein H6850_02615 [Alphaproteobacteria bacterium]|nr:MAG: hypothetical protein H6850_02615 [Alphaproteobacteria bacterium]